LVACALDILTVPLAATVADRIGRRRMLLIGAMYMAGIAFPVFRLIDSGNPLAVLLAMLLIVTIGHAVTYAAIAGLLAEIFPARMRYSGASTAYQVGGMITSGPAPFVAIALVGAFEASWPIAAYIVLACAVTFVALLAAPRPVAGSAR
jgi:MFS family permease